VHGSAVEITRAEGADQSVQADALYILRSAEFASGPRLGVNTFATKKKKAFMKEKYASISVSSACKVSIMNY